MNQWETLFTSQSSEPIMESYHLIKFAQELSELIIKQSLESASISLDFAKKAELPQPTPTTTAAAPFLLSKPKSPTPTLSDKVSVVGMEESVGLENGEKWKDRSPTPTFSQRLVDTTPPTEVRNIYLEGPIPGPANQVLISDSHGEEIEMEEEDEYEDDEDYDSENEKPVVLSGKVTLSVLSGAPESSIAEGPSLSMDDYAKATTDATQSRQTDPKFSGTGKDVSSELANV